MSVPRGALHRAVTDMTVGVARSMRAREQRNREMGFAEIQQQFQFKISGVAGVEWKWANLTVGFDYPFYYAPGQRDAEFSVPHFWYGAEVDTPVAISAAVLGWTRDSDNNAIIGSTVTVGNAGEPGAPFTGFVHLTFQGFAALGEDESLIE